jgi:hypothetical protein
MFYSFFFFRLNANNAKIRSTMIALYEPPMIIIVSVVRAFEVVLGVGEAEGEAVAVG